MIQWVKSVCKCEYLSLAPHNIGHGNTHLCYYHEMGGGQNQKDSWMLMVYAAVKQRYCGRGGVTLSVVLSSTCAQWHACTLIHT